MQQTGEELKLVSPTDQFASFLIDIKTRPRQPESNGIVERFNGTARDESNNVYGNNYLQAEAITAKLMQN